MSNWISAPILIALLLGPGCAHPVVTATPTKMTLSKRGTARDVLDVRFDNVNIQGTHMARAILLIGRTINDSSFDLPHCSWSIDVAVPTADPQFDDPIVSYKNSNISLREVLDSLCAQTGWTYELVRNRLWISFHPKER